MSEAGSDFEVSGSYESFVTVLVLNTLLAIAVFVAFGILRSLRANKYFFAPQFYEQYVLYVYSLIMLITCQ